MQLSLLPPTQHHQLKRLTHQPTHPHPLQLRVIHLPSLMREGVGGWVGENFRSEEGGVEGDKSRADVCGIRENEILWRSGWVGGWVKRGRRGVCVWSGSFAFLFFLFLATVCERVGGWVGGWVIYLEDLEGGGEHEGVGGGEGLLEWVDEEGEGG